MHGVQLIDRNEVPSNPENDEAKMGINQDRFLVGEKAPEVQ